MIPGASGGGGGPEETQVVVSRALLSKTIELLCPSRLRTPRRGARRREAPMVSLADT